MQNAETVLGVLRERGRKGLPLDELYRQLFNPQLYLLAYGRIYSNDGAMTPGVTQETVDGMSWGKIGRIIDAVRHERYRFSPARRVWIPKKNGKLRPLGMPTWPDKLLGEVVRLLLEAYYEPQFSARSHGFRPGLGCHTALGEVARTWTGTTWFVEGDVADCFGSLDHEIMIKILAEKIRDNRFLRLMRNMLRAGYLEDWRWNATLSGAPQGGVVSPILSNIYLHRLDDFAENTLIPEYTRGETRTRNKEYEKVRQAYARARKKGDHQKARELRRKQARLPSVDCDDPGYRRLHYLRYADDTLFGFTGPKAEAEEIKQRLTTFLRDELHLELSAEKTLITHARTGAAKFLGYEITTQHSGTSGRKTNQRQHSAARARPGDQGQMRRPTWNAANPPPREPCKTSATTTSSRPTGRNTGASASTTCSPATSTGWTGCGGSWRPRCSRRSRPSTTRRCRKWRPATRPPSRPRTGRAPASRPSASARTTRNPWSHGSAASPSNGAKRGHHRPRSRPGPLPPQGDHYPAPAEQVRTVPAQRPGAGAPRRQARRPRIPRPRPASMGQAHGRNAAQVPRGLPALPRPDPCRTATSRNPSHGVSHQRAGCRESWHVRFGGGPYGKGPANCGHLAVRPTQRSDQGRVSGSLTSVVSVHRPHGTRPLDWNNPAVLGACCSNSPCWYLLSQKTPAVGKPPCQKEPMVCR